MNPAYPASDTADVVIDADCIRDFCNLGYAQGCPRLPRERDWDAVRFCIARASSEEITLRYSCERDHVPVEHGAVTFDWESETWRDTILDARVQRLATSYVMAYRARQNRALA